MYGLNPEQCKNTSPEILAKLMTCCICKLYPVPPIRDKQMINKVYCTSCAILEKITRTRPTNEDNLILKELIIDCGKFCGLIFTCSDLEYLIEHEKECDSHINEPTPDNLCTICEKKLDSDNHYCILKTNKRIRGFEYCIKENFRFIKKKNDDRFLNFEKQMKDQIDNMNDIIKELNLKIKLNQEKTEELERLIETQSQSVKLENLNNLHLNNTIDEMKKTIKNLMQSYDNKFDHFKNNIEESKNYVNSKFSELESSYNQLNSIISKTQTDSISLNKDLVKFSKDLNDKIQLNETKLNNFINLEKNIDDKMIIDIENVKKEIKLGFDIIKPYNTLKIVSNMIKLKSMKPNISEKYNSLIESDSFVDNFTKSLNLEGLKSIDDPQAFQNQYETVNKNIETCLNNRILFGNISTVIEKAHEDIVYDLIIKNKYNHLISCSNDGSIKIWHLKDNSIVKEIKNAHNEHPIYTLLLNNDEDTLISGGYDSNIRFWDKDYNKIDCIENGSSVYHIILSNNILIVGDDNKLINFYDINTKVLINKIITNHKQIIWKLLLLKSKDILLTGSYDSTIKVWNINNYSIKDSLKLNQCKYTIEGHKDRTRSLIQLKCDNNVIVSSDEYGTIMFHYINNDNEMNYKLINRYEISHYDNNPNQQKHIMFVYELFKYKMLVSITKDSSLLIWDLSNYEIIRNVKIKYRLYSLIGLENDEGIIFTKFTNRFSELIIWK